jgi:hypothetical protein
MPAAIDNKINAFVKKVNHFFHAGENVKFLAGSTKVKLALIKANKQTKENK